MILKIDDPQIGRSSKYTILKLDGPQIGPFNMTDLKVADLKVAELEVADLEMVKLKGAGDQLLSPFCLPAREFESVIEHFG